MMIAWIFLVFVAISQVSSNPLLQALQTCPICQQNAMKNPLAAALPMLLQQQPQFQNVLQGMLPENLLQGILPENSWPAPVAQPNMLPCPTCQPQMPICQPQNPMCQQFCQCPNSNCCPIKTPCPKSPKNNKNQVNQALLDKLLSNPAVKSILDPNTTLFTQNGGEVPKNGRCKNGSPSVINNYIIVPPEVLEEDIKCPPEKENRLKERRRKSKRRRPKQDGVIKEEQKNKAADIIIDLTPPKNNQDTKPMQAEGNTANDGAVRNKDTQTSKSENGTERPRRKRRRRKKNHQPNIKVKVLDENATEPGTLTILTRTNKKTAEDQPLITTTETNNFETTTTESSQDLDNINETNETFLEPTTEKQEKSLNVDEGITQSILPTQATTMQENVETTTETIIPTSEVEIQIQSPPEVTTKAPIIKEENINSVKNQANEHLNSREESVIDEFTKKFPNIPENFVKDLIDHMAQQILKQSLGFPVQYPGYPSETRQLYDDQFHEEVESPVNFHNKHNSMMIGDNRRNKGINNDRETSTEGTKTTVELTEFKHEKGTTPITTTVKPTTIEIASQPSLTEVTTSEPEIMTVISEPVKETILATTSKAKETPKSEEDIYATCDDKDGSYKPHDIYTLYNHGHNRIPELGTEDVVPIFYVNGLDEYYPDFTGDNQYFSDEDFSYLRPEEDRYYYTTDKNYALEELNRERRTHGNNFDNNAKNADNKLVFKVRPHNRMRSKNMRRRRPVAKAVITTIKPNKLKPTTETPKVIVTIEQTTAKSKNIEEIQFKTPPTLENIDFETKPVNKNFYYHDNEHKISTYSDFKSSQLMNDDKFLNNNDKPEEKIETVFARSKVVKYGQTQPRENFGESNEANLFSAEDKAIVMAKSVSGEFW